MIEWSDRCSVFITKGFLDNISIHSRIILFIEIKGTRQAVYHLQFDLSIFFQMRLTTGQRRYNDGYSNIIIDDPCE